MRHRKIRSKLNRTTEHRTALLRNLAKALVREERIHTTDAKAKQLRSFVEHLVTLGKDGSLHARRLAFSELPDKKAVHKVFTEIAPRFKERAGGYTRVVKDAPRAGDGALMSFIEFVEREEKEVKPKKKKRERVKMPQF
jgi:large subunit ribosomal protein L17